VKTDAATGVCEYHLARKGIAVPAAHIVNDEAMCAQCIAGVAIFNFEKIGDSAGDADGTDRKRRYLAQNADARERKRFRDALWRERQRAKSRLNAASPTQDPYESAPAAPACAAFED